MKWANRLHKRKPRIVFCIFSFLVAVICLPAATGAEGCVPMNGAGIRYLLVGDSISDMLKHPSLTAFSEHLLPTRQSAGSGLKLAEVSRLMPWHSHVRPQVVVSALNRLVEDSAKGLPVFFAFQDSPAIRERTGLFFLRGRPQAPFALICPGGGFRYVGSLHEGFPIAEELSEKGFNAFVLQYRTGGEQVACEDMAKALSWIFAHARELDVSTRDYSVWGGSAGARMAADLGSYGCKALGGDDLPKPAVVIMAYTSHDWITKNDPPTFSVVSEDDPIASVRIMRERTAALQRAGIDAQILVVKHAGHGFGTGEGTDAEGWINLAIDFWKKHITE